MILQSENLWIVLLIVLVENYPSSETQAYTHSEALG